ncbi:MAG: ribosome maturation factor RimM [Gammaproteobacteria bacterium]|nr:ribosome maturation factor RimM [Gammaproteobacteria bacterium]
MQSNHSDTFVVVGRISRPYGVRGWNHLTSFTDPQDNLASYKPLALNSGKSETSTWQICQELEFRQTNRGLLVCINASNTREDASRYVNQLIGTQRSCLPAIADNEHYWVDMIGTRVYDTSGNSIGIIDHVSTNGAHEILHIRRDDKEIYVPFVSEYVSKVVPGESLILDWDTEWE